MPPSPSFPPSSRRTSASLNIDLAFLSATPTGRLASAALPADQSGFSIFGSGSAGAGANANAKAGGNERGLKRHSGISTPPMGSPSTWWGGRELADEHRPWMDPSEEKDSVPEAQTEGWIHTREA
ncbi:hypothetical protein C0993_004188, partial [Termitomyces sp. T159_Od127]